MSDTVPTVGVCTCGARLVTSWKWRNMPLTERRALRAEGYAPKHCTDTCERCYQRARYVPSGTLHRREEVLSEWEMFVDRRDSKARNIEALAPRLGMTVDALEKALQRAGVRAWAS